MSDPVLIAVIGVVGPVVGSVATVLVAKIQSARTDPKPVPSDKVEVPSPGGGELPDIRELRVLRALYGEPKGRLLDGYKDKYYKPSLDLTVRKGWVRLVGGKYYMTAMGVEFCQNYLTQLRARWRRVEPSAS